ncbi:glutamate 5-kinase [Candidatus Peregrinibacteria bacterium]|nr:glutamate 5-kinase [Candidatus Peregrinibacteria bacterium]
MRNKKIVVKLGTNAMTTDDLKLDKAVIKDLVRQIAEAHGSHDIVLVTSGAMGAGRATLKKPLKYDEVTTRQIYAVVGQVKLMELYSNLFEERGRIVAQMLATKEDFNNRTHFLNTKNCIESLFREDIVPIMNENDFVCIEELMFTDNDELAGMISKLLAADKLIILSNVSGVYDKEGKVIPEFRPDEEMPRHIISSEKSSFGKGGMQNKFGVAQAIAKHGTEVFITSSKEKDVITRILAGESVGSRFLAHKV